MKTKLTHGTRLAYTLRASAPQRIAIAEVSGELRQWHRDT
jgi:hypothetical protein